MNNTLQPVKIDRYLSFFSTIIIDRQIELYETFLPNGKKQFIIKGVNEGTGYTQYKRKFTNLNDYMNLIKKNLDLDLFNQEYSCILITCFSCTKTYRYIYTEIFSKTFEHVPIEYNDITDF